MEEYIGKIINGDCIEVMKTLSESSVDLIVTSPPYNCNIPYDTHLDNLKGMIGTKRSTKDLTEAKQWYQDEGSLKNKDYFHLYKYLSFYHFYINILRIFDLYEIICI